MRYAHPGLFLRLAILALISAPAMLRAQAPSAGGKLFQSIPPEQSGIRFDNQLVETEEFNIVNNQLFYNGNGVAVGDLNGDELPDIFFTGTQANNRLYFNKGNFRFEDVTDKAGINDTGGIARGVVMVDLNSDGLLDIYVAHFNAANRLYINNGDGTFTDQAKKYGLDFNGHSICGYFFDYDLDGDLDCYLGITGATTYNDFYVQYGDPDRFFRNDKGHFVDVTKKVGVTDNAFFNGLTVGDLNCDGYPDVFISNDFERRDGYYLNNRNGTFTLATASAMNHISQFSMGSDIADYNNDGLPDLFVVDMLPEDRLRLATLKTPAQVNSPIFDSSQIAQNVLQLNRGNGLFSDIAPYAGIDATDWSWAVLVADYDLDGWKDVFVANGHARDLNNPDITYSVKNRKSKLQLTQDLGALRPPNYGYRNNHDLSFRKVSSEWGLADSSCSYGAAYADLDNDGDLDLVVNNLDSVPFIYRNNAVEQHRGNFLRVKLEGTGQNRGGVGARIELRSRDGRLQMQEEFPTRGYISSSDPTLVFGLGKDESVDTLVVVWPGGASQQLTDINANQTITLRQSEAARARIKPAPQPKPVFEKVDPKKSINFRHVDINFDDLKRERLLPHRLSQLGPGIAVADVNGDGLDDVFLGNGKEYPARLMIQTQSGKFIPTDTALFERTQRSEDMGALFFDADNDGDPDLYVVSGGAEFLLDDPELQDHLYINDGKGHFTRSAGALPTETASGSCVVAGDYDGDGDLDLFVGGRMVPGKYPMPTRSFILRNDGGRFSDATAEVAPELASPGMMCAALWSDYDNDGRLDLITTGEWMALRLFHNEGGRLLESHGTGLDSALGWWNSLTPGDFDNDGDIDYIAGNIGLNWRYRASRGGSIDVNAADFDGNGSIDAIVSYYDTTEHKRYPIPGRPQMISQIPSIQAKFTTFSAYGRATLDDMFPKGKLDSSYHLRATEFASSYVENLGNGHFALHPLPALAQLSPVFGSIVQDFNADGKLDLLLSGNFFDGPEPQIPRRDAGYGLLLLGDGTGSFSPLSIQQSGFKASGDARGLATLRAGKGSTLFELVANNNGPTQIFAHDFSREGAKLWQPGRGMRCTHAIITMKDGSHRRVEFPLGSGYLTQSSHTLVVTPAMMSMKVYDRTKMVEEVTF